MRFFFQPFRLANAISMLYSKMREERHLCGVMILR